MSDIDLTEAQQSGFMAVEDELIELRDARISIHGYANGVVVNEKDGTLSGVVRMRTRWATDKAIEIAAPLIEAAVREQVAREITDLRRPLPLTMQREDAAYERAARIARGVDR